MALVCLLRSGNEHAGVDCVINFQTVVADMKVLKKYYDGVRLVDPIPKQIITVNDDNSEMIYLESSTELCYQCWKTGQFCSNCISMRSATEQDTFVKFEMLDGKILMITAMPVVFEGRVVALELMKDVTNISYLQNCLRATTADEDPLNLHTSIARLNELVVKDDLTGVYNRKYINERLPAELLKSGLEKRPLSIVMADIDFFKEVNDKYGHVMGDQVLKTFATILENHVRHNIGSWGARYGGDEFLLCLLNCGKEAARETVERMRRSIEEMAIVRDDEVIKITASFGVFTYINQDDDMASIIDLVDRNLYKAKQSGRNGAVAE